MKKRQKQLEWEQREKEEPPPEGVIKYGLMGNNIFLRFTDSTMNHFYNNRVIQAMQFGQKLVFDCGYENDMVKREIINTAKQLMLLFGDNRVHDSKYNYHTIFILRVL